MMISFPAANVTLDLGPDIDMYLVGLCYRKQPPSTDSSGGDKLIVTGDGTKVVLTSHPPDDTNFLHGEVQPGGAGIPGCYVQQQIEVCR